MDAPPRWRIGVAAGVVLVAGAVGGALVTQAAAPQHVVALPTPSASTDAAGTETMLVDVQGAVQRPGVYTLPPGARVIDALARAGGANADADTTGLNLAQELADGMQVVVPVLGAEPAAGAADDGLVSVNTADAAELETLPRVGPALATAIIQHREEHGPFADVAELDQVPGIGPAVLAQIEPFVTL